jgi:hypothetical protein
LACVCLHVAVVYHAWITRSLLAFFVSTAGVVVLWNAHRIFVSFAASVGFRITVVVLSTNAFAQWSRFAVAIDRAEWNLADIARCAVFVVATPTNVVPWNTHSSVFTADRLDRIALRVFAAHALLLCAPSADMRICDAVCFFAHPFRERLAIGINATHVRSRYFGDANCVVAAYVHRWIAAGPST